MLETGSSPASGTFAASAMENSTLFRASDFVLLQVSCLDQSAEAVVR
jgi:hypothetical protein